MQQVSAPAMWQRGAILCSEGGAAAAALRAYARGAFQHHSPQRGATRPFERTHDNAQHQPATGRDHNRSEGGEGRGGGRGVGVGERGGGEMPWQVQS